MSTLIILKLIVTVLSIASLLAYRHQELGISRLLTGKISPTPRPGELRSKYLRRVSTFSGIWLVLLLALAFLLFTLREGLGIRPVSSAMSLTVTFVLGVLTGMACLGMFGSYVWSILIRIFGRDERYSKSEESLQNIT